MLMPATYAVSILNLPALLLGLSLALVAVRAVAGILAVAMLERWVFAWES